MKASAQEIELSAIVDSDAEERLRWQRFDSEALLLCPPLAGMLKRKDIVYHLDMSEAQVSRELSPNYDNRISLSLGLYLLRHTQHERLAQLVMCDGAGYRLPEPQRRRVSPEEELRALKAECQESGAAGRAILDGMARRLRGAK